MELKTPRKLSLCLLPDYNVCIIGGLVGALLITADAPGCGTSVGRGPTGHKKKRFHPGVQLYPKVSSLKVSTSRRI